MQTNNNASRITVERIETVWCARQLAGGTAKLARIANVTPPMVSKWLWGTRPVAPASAVAIELALGVPADKLCPLVPWDALPMLQRARSARASKTG